MRSFDPKRLPLPDGATASEPAASRCPLCRGTGFQVLEDAERGRSYARLCECRQGEASRDLLRSTRIPRRFAECDFDTFQPRNESQVQGLAAARDFVADYSARKARGDNEFGLLFLGGPGLGKTHLAVAALRALVAQQSVPGLFSDFRDLLKTLQASYDPVSEASEMDVLRPLFQTEVLLLDDLGACRMTEWVRDTVGHIINTRYNDRKVTLITTNLPDDAPGRANDRPSLTERVGPAVRSRLHEMCVVVMLEGEDFRLNVTQSPRRRSRKG